MRPGSTELQREPSAAEVRTNSGICRGTRRHGLVFREQNQRFHTAANMHYPARGENTQMWVVWSLSALSGACLVLSLFETPPGEGRLRPNQGTGRRRQRAGSDRLGSAHERSGRRRRHAQPILVDICGGHAFPTRDRRELLWLLHPMPSPDSGEAAPEHSLGRSLHAMSGAVRGGRRGGTLDIAFR